jgi:hypothetical protein
MSACYVYSLDMFRIRNLYTEPRTDKKNFFDKTVEYFPFFTPYSGSHLFRILDLKPNFLVKILIFSSLFGSKILIRKLIRNLNSTWNRDRIRIRELMCTRIRSLDHARIQSLRYDERNRIIVWTWKNRIRTRTLM